ncbi:MAG: hypothetical protein ACR2L8_12100 [Solirubrobacteraceae bacterium]
MHARSAICLLILLIAALMLPAAGAEAEVVGELGCAGGAGERCRPLADPCTPADDSGTALAGLGSPGAPVDDLAAALERLAVAGDPVVADAAQAEALAILEGAPLARRAYSGIPLLNWNAPAKLRTVPAGGTVEIREVRFPDHAISDTWLLEFADPSQPYTIRYRVAELGGVAGGELKPAPLLADGETRMGSTHAALLPLVAPELPTGTLDASRFTRGRGLAAGGRESTRVAEQVVEVRMPAPGLTRGRQAAQGRTLRASGPGRPGRGAPRARAPRAPAQGPRQALTGLRGTT